MALEKEIGQRGWKKSNFLSPFDISHKLKEEKVSGGWAWWAGPGG
jgi:hypothetical protein